MWKIPKRLKSCSEVESSSQTSHGVRGVKMGPRGSFITAACIILLQWISHVNLEELAPPYFNLASGRRITASATCGEDGPELYCKLVGSSASIVEGDLQLIQGQVCDHCNSSDPRRRHPPEYAIDGTSNWWQSPPMSRGLKYAQVNLTIDLGQEFHVAYVFVKMANSPRPGVWVLERSVDNGKTYKPWQYFADTPSDCADLFGIESLEPIRRDDSVTCETQFSKVVPLEDGEIVVSLLNNRPSSTNFFNSPVLQEWTKATNIRFRLLRPKTLLGQWVNFERNDFTLTRRFFYSIRDISIGGRCVCNGHAESCDITDPEDPYKLLCRCQHNTCGAQCQRCCPGFVQKAWRQSKAYDPFTCEPCNCFGHSDECVYDPEIDRQRLSLDISGKYEGGGVCQNCRHNTEGINCDRCKPKYYRPFGKPLNATDVCQRCECDVFYSTGNCAEGTGQCECRPEYTSPLCDSCSEGYYGYPNCRPCDCNKNGTRGDVCEVGGGQCPCKQNYAGKNCDQCAEGFYNFPDCIPCECSSPGSASDICDLENGQCECAHNFGGRSCERCEHGFYNYPQCEYCSCDPRGTLGEICDKSSGQCLCKPGYDGPRCDQCKAGFYGYPDCRPCNCSDVGSASSVCSPNGKCPCLPNFSGRACDQCSPGYFKYPECIACNCDTSGSLGVSCDDEGRCQCRGNFDGLKCDKCLDGFYNFPICEECNCDPAGVIETFAGCGSVPKGELCKCKDRVEGRICNKCKPLFWNLQPNNPNGCEDCNCNTAGTVGGLRVCGNENGQCSCKPRVVSRSCNECADGFFNLQEDSVYGCADCGCNAGGSISPLCDKLSGQCVCRARVEGRTCSEPIQLHYFPTVYQHLYEAEDGQTPAGSAVRFGYDEQIFPEYSWRGYAIFSSIQNEIVHDIHIDKPSLYRVVMRYVNLNEEPVLGKVTFAPENPNDVEQTYIVRFDPSREPKLVSVAGATGNIPTPFVLSQGIWNVSISTEKNLFLDYFVLLPAAYYEATILQQRVQAPCLAGEAQGSCRHFAYPSVADFDRSSAEGSYVYDDTQERTSAVIITDERSGGSGRGAVIDENQPELHLDLNVGRPGRYVLVLLYFTPPTGQRSHVSIDVNTQRERLHGTAVLQDCAYSSACRQVVTDSEGKVASFHFDGTSVQLVLRGEDSSNTAVDSVIAIPSEQWSLDFIQPRPVCIRKDGVCLAASFPTAPDSIKVEVESEDVHLHATNLPADIYDDATGLVYLDQNIPSVEVSSKLPHSGYYVFAVHFYQPDHPEFNVDVVLQSGQNYEAKLPVFPCPSNTGCRAILRQADGNYNFYVQENFTLTFKPPAGSKGVWLDYVYVVPTNEYTPALLEESPVDVTGEFIAQCGKNHFFMDTDDVSNFCRESTFALTTEFNNGALPCQCDLGGSTSLECDKFGGQCQCKPGVIGRRCSRCKTGYYGFPDCKPCDCPSTALCDAATGACICPPRVTGARCDQCVANTYGYDPIIGCEECNCNPLGVHQGNLQCDALSGQCQCKQNIVGRMCEKCSPGYWAFPYCQLCDCDVRGTTEEICDQETAQCFCKENVHGPACDVCKSGTFNLQESNPKGCTKCFCFGKASQCTSSQLYRTSISDMRDWSGETVVKGASSSKRQDNLQLASFDKMVRVVLAELLPEDGVFYFSAPSAYLGNKLTSYGGVLNYTIVYVEGISGHPISAADVILIGGDLSLYHASLEQPTSVVPLDMSIELTERNFVLQSGLPATRENIMVVLKDLRAILIRGSYSESMNEARLSNVRLEIAVKEYNDFSEVANAVEHCNCPPNYMGLSCEECAPGYYRIQTGPFGGFCVPCQCNGHADTCDPVTGTCINCKHNTVGDHCEKCDVGYHGDATQGTPSDCLICACPLPIVSNNFANSCEVTEDGAPISCECQPGYHGDYCESCAPGYYGQPHVVGDYCKPCNCSGNIDVTDPFGCDTVSGECINCLSNSYGPACSLCAPGFYGDAVNSKDCQKCHCHECGTQECNSYSGDCQCKANVVGEKCDRCAPDHFGFSTCQGCSPCSCGEASESTQCDDTTGQCRCRPGAAGRRCDRCASGFWNYSPAGCQSCNCNTNFSIGVGCNPYTGQCECLRGVIGEKCEACPYRWVLIPDEGCDECNSCIHNILDVTDELRDKIDPVRQEFQSVALSFFTQQKLASLDQLVNELRYEVGRIDISQINFAPLEASTVELEAAFRTLKVRADLVKESTADNADDARKIKEDALQLEKLVQETAAKSRSTVAEVAALAEAFEGGAGPQIEQAIQEAHNILQEIRSRNFDQRRLTAEHELQEAISLLARMKEESVAVRENAEAVGNLNQRLTELQDKLKDLVNQSQASLTNSQQAEALLKKIKGSSSVSTVEDIASRNKTATEKQANAGNQLSKADSLLQSAKQSLQDLSENLDRVRASKESLNETLTRKDRELEDVRAPVYEAEIHASELAQQAADLDLILADTRDTSESALSAANAYKNIVNGIDEALRASLEAQGMAENATEMSNGVGDKALTSHERSRDLLEQAQAAHRMTEDELAPRLEAAKAAADAVEDSNNRAAEGIAFVNSALDKIPARNLKEVASNAPQQAEAAKTTALESLVTIGNIADKLPAQLDKAKLLGRDVDATNKATGLALSQMDRLNAVIPDLKQLLDRTKEKQDSMQLLGQDLSAKIAELRQKVALARDQANRIKVGVTFYPNSTLQLRNPEGLSRGATANEISFFFRTKEANGFLLFLGNEVGTSKQLRRTLTDDFMALEVQNGYLTLTVDLGSKPQSIVNDRYVADDMWYQAVVERTGKSVKLKVRAEGEAGAEEDIVKDAILYGTFSIFNLDQDLSKLYVGGYPSATRIPPVVRFASFEGAMEELVIGDIPVGLWNFADAANIYGAVERDKLKNLQQSTGYRFDGDGYAILDRRQFRFGSRSNVRLQFKTFAEDGLVFLVGRGRDFMSLELRSGKVVYQFDLGDGVVSMESPQTYNDGEWHTIDAVRGKRDAVLRVDDQEVAQGSSGGQDEDLSTTDYMYFGGYPGGHNFDGVTNIDFDGCIDNVEIFGTPVDLSQNAEAFGVVPGCPAKVAGTVSFNDSASASYIALPGVNIENFAQINFKFKTNDDNGLILYMANEDQSNHLSLSLAEGALVLRASPGRELSSGSQNKYNDGTWHVVTVTADGAQLRLDVDDFEMFSVNVSSQINIPAAPIYFGGVPETFALAPGAAAVSTPFVGCIGDATINGKFINYATTLERVGAALAKCPQPDAGSVPVRSPVPKTPILIESVGQQGRDEEPVQPEAEEPEATTATTTKTTTTTATPTPETTPSAPEVEEAAPELEPTTTTTTTTTEATTTTTTIESTTTEASTTTTTTTTTEKPAPAKTDEDGEDEAYDTDDSEPKAPEAAPTTTTVAPETTTPYVPTNQCRLPLRPADDPDVSESSGRRFGDTKESYMEFTSLRARYRQRSEFSVHFKTSAPDGVIFYAADNRHSDHITLYLSEGKLHYAFNCGSGPALLVSPERYDDDQWHHVIFARDQHNGTLTVDNVLVAEGLSQGDTRTINIDVPYFAGGIPESLYQVAESNLGGKTGGLVGCLKDLRMNNRAVEPSSITGVSPCSQKVEEGSFFSVDGGYIKAQDNFRVGLDIEITMEIRPRSTSGVLLSVHARRDYLLLQMVNGTLTFTVDNGRGPISASYTPSTEFSLCDGNWHYIQAIKAKNVVTLSVDNVFVAPGIGVAGVSSTDTNHPLFVGGHPNPKSARGVKTTEQYVGCIRKLLINKTHMRFSPEQAFGSVTTSTCPVI